MEPSLARLDSSFDSTQGRLGRLSLHERWRPSCWMRKFVAVKAYRRRRSAGYLNRLTARVELVPFPTVKRGSIFTVVNAANDGKFGR